MYPEAMQIDGTAEDACGVHPDFLLPQQQQHMSAESDCSSFERWSSGHGGNTEDEFSWEYAEPQQQHTKDFLGQRKKDVRSSLDWDFDSHRPLVITRRSKDFGEESQMALAGSLCQGRSTRALPDSSAGYFT